MKKGLLIVLVCLTVIFGALLIIPVFFKDDILKIVQEQSSRYIKAELKIGDLNLSMFRSFPDLNIALKDVIVTGKDEFAGDTVVNIPLFEASVNLKSLISGNELIVNRILLKDCRLQPTVDTAGRANWDILIGEDESGTETESGQPEDEKESTEKSLSLKDISIRDLYLSYRDYQNSTYAGIGNVNLNISGNLSAKNTMINVLLDLDNISFRQQNSVWINRTNLDWEAGIAADFEGRTFEIKENRLSLNDLVLNLDGRIALAKDKYKVDLKLNAPDTQFRSLLSLVPKNLQHYIEGVEADGEFKLDVVVQGEYFKDHLPMMQADLLVNDASIKYKDLPESVRKINVDLKLGNPGGPADSTRIQLDRLSFDIAGNPFNMHLNLLNPNDPELDGGATGTINFANLKKAIPMKDVTLEGVVTTDVTFKGRYQYIEKEEYERFIAKGSIVLKDVLFVNDDFPQGISIPQGSIVITPAHLNLNKLEARVNSSDFTLQGKVSNYLPYILKNETLKGDFSLTSNLINLNEFIVTQAGSEKSSTLKQDSIRTVGETDKPSAAEGALEIPKNFDIRFSTRINDIVFDNLDIKNVTGGVTLDHAVATLKELSMDLLNGRMVMNGKYSTANPMEPEVNFNLTVSDFDISAAYNAFTFIRKSIPITMNCEGRISADMHFTAQLDNEMSPVMTTANGNGYLESKGILINNNPAMNQLASFLKNDELSRISISHLKIDFKLEDGDITVEPFKTTLAGNPVTIYGSQSVDGKLDYTLSMNVDRKFFGKEINNLLKSIPGSDNIQNLDIDAKIGGTLDKPTIKPDLSKAVKTVTKEAEKKLKGNILDGIQNIFKKKKGNN